MTDFTKEFVSAEPRHFKFKIGNILASSLAGFVAGAAFSGIVLGLLIIYLLQNR